MVLVGQCSHTHVVTSPYYNPLLPTRWTEKKVKLCLHHHELEMTHNFHLLLLGRISHVALSSLRGLGNLLQP